MNARMLNLVQRYGARHRFLMSVEDGARVLDLGCGTGNNGVTLRSYHPLIELHGIDTLSPSEVPSFYKYTSLDIHESPLPFPDEHFDIVIFTHVIEHLRSPFIVAREIHRVMKKGARIYVETPNWTTIFVPSFGFRRDQHNPFNFFDDPTHVRPYTKQSLFEFLFQFCDLNVIKVGTMRNWLRVPLDFFVILFGLISRKRSYVVSSFWNLYGWCIYGIGKKTVV